MQYLYILVFLIKVFYFSHLFHGKRGLRWENSSQKKITHYRTNLLVQQMFKGYLLLLFVLILSILYWTQKFYQSKVINDILQLKDCLNPMSKPYIFGPFLIICTLDLNKQWSVLSSSLPKFMLKIYITVRRMVYLSSNGGEKC